MGSDPVTRLAVIFSAVAGVWLALPLRGLAQGGGAAINRPSEGPSSRVGTVGGAYTQYGFGSANRGQSAADQSGLFNSPGRGFQFRSEGGPAGIPSALRPGRSMWGGGGGAYAGYHVLGFGQVDSRKIEQASLMTLAMDFEAPIGGWMMPIPGMATTLPNSGAGSSGNQFLDYFGLARGEEQSVEIAAALTLAERKATENAVSKATLDERARALFRAGTTAGAEDRWEQLSQASRLATTVKNIDASDPAPLLLIAHAALEREQLEVAMYALFDAVRRHPDVFAERPDVGAWFGSRELYDLQMRRCIRIGEDHPDRPAYFVIQAYAAWSLKDIGRARSALAALTRIERPDPDFERIAAFRSALEAAIR
jgi:hypothetical protein